MGKFSAQKKSTHRFAIGALIFAAVFLLAAVIGWKVLWDFMDAYERTRPKNAITAYMDSLTAEHMLAADQELLTQIDGNLQSKEQIQEFVRKATEGKLKYAKNTQKSTENVQGYYVLADKDRIGSFTLNAGKEWKFGLIPWAVKNESFDFSYLKGEPFEVTVPENCSVSVNGYTLGESYRTAADTHYPVFEEFYGSYDLPVLVTYTVKDYLVEVPVEIRNAAGEVVPADTDWETELPVCDAAMQHRLDDFANEFLISYVRFSGSSGETAGGNFAALRTLLVPGGALSQRLATALDGLQFGQSVLDKIVDVQFHHRIPLGNDRYLYDMTYLVDTTGRKGVVQTTNNMKLVIAEINGNLYAEAMASYS